MATEDDDLMTELAELSQVVKLETLADLPGQCLGCGAAWHEGFDEWVSQHPHGPAGVNFVTCHKCTKLTGRATLKTYSAERTYWRVYSSIEQARIIVGPKPKHRRRGVHFS